MSCCVLLIIMDNQMWYMTIYTLAKNTVASPATIQLLSPKSKEAPYVDSVWSGNNVFMYI